MTRLRALRVGKARPLAEDGPVSAIAKAAVGEPLWLGPEGLAGDQQADRRHHGGPEKAVHHYPYDHYPFWRETLPGPPQVLAESGAFGENLVTCDMTEETVCVGDILRLGGAVVQVSQARQPCRTLNTRFGVPDMARRVQDSGRTGWYYRVLEPGEVAPDAALERLERPRPDWPLVRVLRLLFREPECFDELASMAEVPELAGSWRALARKRVDTRQVEDWSRRLDEGG